jgi:hypothetical protein
MRSRLTALLAGALFACAGGSQSTKEQERPAAATPAVAPASAAVPARPAAVSSPPAQAPMTAAEAAQKAHEEWVRKHGSGGRG